ncbi:MAG TPA: fumarylacetoacetate hydrolase family protein [Alphaproteobacteria bacterium]|nr:fumarylacetoacetate hydrolase family protein [Alphaproteobacteria bacterium]
MGTLDIDAAVAEFWRAREQGIFFPPAWSGRLSLEDAFRIQLGLIARREALGERRIGWKVGLTSEAIQQQFGVHEPVFGCLLEAGVKRTGEVFRTADLIKPGFENEICMRLGGDLAGPDVDGAAARQALAACYPAFEIIETRGDFTKDLPLAIADNAQQKAIVLGAETRPGADLDLAAIPVAVEIGGKEVASGRGDAVLGNPLNSLAWLARKLHEFGRGLKAGELVMTGSFTRQFPLAKGDRIRACFSRLGAVEASFV